MNNYDEVMLVVDQDQRFIEAKKIGKKIDPEREADVFSTLMKVLGSRIRRYALVSEHDEIGLRAYHKAGYEVTLVNGNRPIEINHFVSKNSEMIKGGKFNHLVMVTTDPTLLLLATHADSRVTDVSVWASTLKFDKELALPSYNFRDLNDILPGSPKVEIMVDYENIHYGIQKQDGDPDPKMLIEAIRTLSADYGEIKNITAYADWELLGKSCQRNIQRELVQLDVETRYLINMRGKNTADMRVANEIRDLIEKGLGNREEVDVIVLVTGDRDFREIVKTAQERGKKVVLVALKNGLSRDLENVASEVKYLDEYIRIEPKKEKKNEADPRKKTIQIIIKSKSLLEGKGEKWLPVEEVVKTLEKSGFNSNDLLLEELFSFVTQKNATGKIIKYAKLNPSHRMVKEVARVIFWVQDRITFCLKQKGMPWVDSAFLVKGMALDKVFQEWGIGQDRPDAEKWLDILYQNKFILKQILLHPKDPTHTITTWILPERVSSEKITNPWEKIVVTSPPSEESTSEEIKETNLAESPIPINQPISIPVEGWSLVGLPA
jgi:uncharacterized protein (TIGR00288 family)